MEDIEPEVVKLSEEGEEGHEDPSASRDLVDGLDCVGFYGVVKQVGEVLVQGGLLLCLWLLLWLGGGLDQRLD